MAGNIIQLVMQHFGPQVLDAITKALGITREQAETAVGASVPALLSGVLGRLQTPESRRTVGSALDSAGTGGLADIGALIRGGDHQRLVESGTGLLGSLFGKSDAGGRAEAVGSFAGVGQGRAQRQARCGLSGARRHHAGAATRSCAQAIAQNVRCRVEWVLTYAMVSQATLGQRRLVNGSCDGKSCGEMA
jgi:hypothetical protein